MKHLQILACAILCLTVYPTKAQVTMANTQYTIIIKGTPFNIEVDDRDASATIIDHKYQIDDRKYAINNKTRKITGLSNEQNRTIEIPETYEVGEKTYTIKTIGHAAFAGYSNIDNIVIPASVTTIGDYAFFNSSVVAVTIAETVSSIGARAFGRCPKLKHVNLPAYVQNAYGKALYAESKKCVPVFYKPNYAPEQQLKKVGITQTVHKKSPKTVQPAAFSDVDENIPETRSENENTFAMIIVNENYENEEDVQCALNDGRIFRKYCESVLGINPKHIYYEENATMGKIRGIMGRVTVAAEAYDGDAKFIVYYAGHGIPNEATKDAYLLPVDGIGSNLKTAISLNEFYHELGKLNAQSITVFMDACFSGAARGGGMLAHARSVAFAPEEGKPQGKMVVFSAATGAETAWPYLEKGHGLFTYFLLKKLKESKGNVTYGDLDSYIRKNVKRSIVDLEYAKRQSPSAKASPALESIWRSMKLK